MNKSVRRWWRYKLIKKKYTSNVPALPIIKILKIKKLSQVIYFNKLNFHFLTYRLLQNKSCIPSICWKSSKFKKVTKYTRLNRWEMLHALNSNAIPNIYKYVW